MSDNSYWNGWSSRGLVVHHPSSLQLPWACSQHGHLKIAELFTQWVACLRMSKLKETDGRVLGEHIEACSLKTFLVKEKSRS